MTVKSLLNENLQVRRAVQLIEMGARMQVLETETGLAYERLLRLYREVTGKSPSKGQLPYSTDWFTEWQPNIHASLFLNIYDHLNKTCAVEQIDLIAKAYDLYLAEIKVAKVEPMLSITRAWRLVKFVDSDMLCLTRCDKCGGNFVTHTHEFGKGSFQMLVCGLCVPPARAGKSKRRGTIH
jgi:flagellar transcriptional activator FlhC